MATRLKIRGIYSTALTKLFLDSGYRMAEPSAEIQERFGLKLSHDPPDVLIRDPGSLQGVEIVGEADQISSPVRLIQERLLDVALMALEPCAEPEALPESPEEPRDRVCARLEFGGGSKTFLDTLRSSMVPTLARHHRLRIIHPHKLEKAERQIRLGFERQEEVERALFQELILIPLHKAGTVRLEQVKISGKPVRPREGIPAAVEGERIVVRRSFSGGRYDGLDLPIEEGDYCLTEIQEGAWVLKHSYYSKAGKPKGDYFNINTPLELYPYGARYLDLEVDVIRRIGGKPFIVDRENLAMLSKEGKISVALEKKALEVAAGLVAELSKREA